ncbi:MAG: helix-turn-helix domain-containing protein [Cyanobacteria bacterium SZAS LIN-3]|nr:helix-turn-helix domain-containing protein [Cyanobacteria bacterium SZAS LIN-3]MBS2010346.1 helix-turn-helix domain-containing protein [Cyanobacteria bacterium SZAS TMP-1]
MKQEIGFGAASVHSELLSRAEAAAYLGVAKQTLAIWKCTKRYNLPFIKIGKLIKYKRSDLDQFIADNSQSS